MSAKNNLKASSAQNLRGRSTLVGPKLGLRTRPTERERATANLYVVPY